MSYFDTSHNGISDFRLYNQRVKSHEVHCHGGNNSIWGYRPSYSMNLCTGSGFWGSLKAGLGYGIANSLTNLLFAGASRLFGGLFGGLGTGLLGGGLLLGNGILGNGLLSLGNSLGNTIDWSSILKRNKVEKEEKEAGPGTTPKPADNNDNKELKGYTDLGFNETDAKALKAANVSVEKATEYTQQNIKDVNLIKSYIEKNISAADAKKYGDAGFTSADDIKALQDANISAEDAKNYKENTGITTTADMINLAGAKITPDEAKKYKTAGITTAEDMKDYKNSEISPELAQACNTNGIKNKDEIIAIKDANIKPEELDEAKVLLKEGADLKTLTKALNNADEAKTLLNNLGLITDDNKVKFHPNFVVLKLIEKSGLDVQFAYNPENNTYLEGKLGNLSKDETGRISYNIADKDCTYSLLAMEKDKEAYTLTNIINTGYKTSQKDTKEADGDIDYINPNWSKRVYKFNNKTGNLELENAKEMKQLVSDGHTAEIEQKWIHLKKGDDVKTAPNEYGS